LSADAIEFYPHSDKQSDVIFSDAEITAASTGTQWGKTQAGTLWMQRQMFTYTDPKDNFIVAAPTYKILQQSIIPYFLYHLKPFGKYNGADAVFKLNEGGQCFFRTETDPDSIVGIPNVRAGWLDEAGKLRLYFWENYLARAAAKGAKTLLTSSPYALNWFWHKLIKPASTGARPDVKLIRAASWENPYHTLHDPAKRQAMRETMDARRFNMIFGGEFGQMAGLVYDCWDDAQNYIPETKLPAGTRYYGGIDWGFTEPFALKIRAVLPSGEQIGVSEFYKSGQTISDIKEVCAKKLKIYSVEMFYCDPSQPGAILELNRAGIPAVAANNDIRRGIDAHYELIKTRKYKEFIGACPHTQDERETYHYPEPEDLAPDDNAKERKPVQQNDHLMDADRYLSISLSAAAEKRKPIISEGKPKIHRDDMRTYFESLKKKRPGGRVISDY
jgi:hypothetical protein